MFDRPFELSFEEGHRQTKLKQERYADIKNKQFFKNQLWKDTDQYGKELSELIEYERGSIFGGLITVAVFIGFGYLLWNDFVTNLNEKLYSLTVRDRLLSSEQCGNTEINF